MHHAQRGWQQGLKPHRTGRGRCERLALGVGALRFVAGDDQINDAAGHALGHGGAVGFAAQRRPQLAEGVVGPDIQLVQRQVVGRHAAGDGQPARLGSGNGVQRRTCADLAEVVAGARQLNQADVALHDHRFGDGGRGGQAQPGGELAFGGRGVQDQFGVFGMGDHQCVEGGGVRQGPAQHPRIGHRAIAVREGHRAGFLQQPDLGHGLAGQSARQGGGGQHAHARRGGGAAHQEIHQRRFINDRVGVGHHDHGGDAACGRCGAGTFQAFAMLRPRLAGEDAGVNQAGRQHQAMAVDDFRIGGFGIVEQTRADIGDLAVFHQQAAAHIHAAGRINQAGIPEGNPAVHAIPRDSASRMAMRMATPISTCSEIRLTTTSSAMSDAISTPRFMGPGCMTSAPGLAMASLARSRP